MLSAYAPGPKGLERLHSPPARRSPRRSSGSTCSNPTPEEERQVEQTLGVDVPTREEMREIETSNRLYEDNGALYLTTTVLYKADTNLPETTQVTFILAGTRLVTNRYADLLAFKGFTTFAETHPTSCGSAALLLTGLLEAIVNRIADVLERVGGDIDTVSLRVFPRRASVASAAITSTSCSRSGKAASSSPRRARPW